MSESEGTESLLPKDETVDYEVEIVLLIQTTKEDIQEALKRSGLTLGSLIGEAMIENIVVYSPADEP